MVCITRGCPQHSIKYHFILITVASAQHLPEVLIQQARALIHKAEQDLHRHHEGGRQHLTKALEEEIEKVRHLERELVAMEQHKHLSMEKVFEVEERLLHHEHILAQELMKIEHNHRREQEGHVNREHETGKH